MELALVTKNTFGELVLKSQRPVLVLFSVELNGICQIMESLLNEISDERIDIRIVKMDPKNPKNFGLLRKYDVQGFPTVVLFKGGSVLSAKRGALRKADLHALADSAFPL